MKLDKLIELKEGSSKLQLSLLASTCRVPRPE